MAISWIRFPPFNWWKRYYLSPRLMDLGVKAQPHHLFAIPLSTTLLWRASTYITKGTSERTVKSNTIQFDSGGHNSKNKRHSKILGFYWKIFVLKLNSVVWCGVSRFDFMISSIGGNRRFFKFLSYQSSFSCQEMSSSIFDMITWI